MWSTVLVMAVVAAIDPLRIGVVAFMLSRSRPVRLLLPFFLLAFTANVAVGAALLFVFKNVTSDGGRTTPPGLEIGIGVVALAIATLSITGVLERLVNRVRARRAVPATVGEHAVEGGTPPTVDSLPGLSRLPEGMKAALRGESAWAAALLGLINGFPTPYYLAAMAAALTSGAAVAEQMAAMVVFNLVAFLAAVIPIVSFWLAPEATRSAVERIYEWMGTHHRLVVAVIAGAIGVFFLAMGLSHA
ncbi:GAP family protein [Mycobacterium sp. CBMA247]|nr:GAP family protein [Mycolicibacterium sp. CBMA 329]MUL88175.1 GAP family protein [Mycolicibacterium sp. CBMA 331]MUL99376.1 GAP family protein [Mycolicibacterium sp. CBMA 334]MUM25981.1 GAP family protein [Mycolicibacterium sp. CBMA 295]MUM39822.1 GAP family protein [Mycolicibacterium sp. CBMA 247]MUM44240.1 GAP family protein [Mycolicibacterium sp. CBMA 294]